MDEVLKEIKDIYAMSDYIDGPDGYRYKIKEDGNWVALAGSGDTPLTADSAPFTPTEDALQEILAYNSKTTAPPITETAATAQPESAISYLAKNPEYADARTQALMEHQKAKSRADFGTMAALYGSGPLVDLIGGDSSYITKLKERADAGIDEEAIDKQISERGQQLTRQVQKGASQIASQLEKQQAAKGGVTSAQEAKRPQQVATEKVIEGLQGVEAFLAGDRERLLDEAGATVEDALQAVYLHGEQKKKDFQKATSQLALAFMRLKSKEGVQADLGALQTVNDLAGDYMNSEQMNGFYQQLYGTGAFGQRPTEERINSVYKVVMKKAIEEGNAVPEAPEALIKGLLSARPPGKSILGTTNLEF
jgi:hypothetical protein